MSKRKPKLRDLSYAVPTGEEKRTLITSLVSASPISAAVMGAVLVEHELEGLIRKRFRRNDDDTWKDLLNDQGPLRSFHSKILTAYAFGIVDDTTRDNLDIVRQVRNAFAHAKTPLDFEHPLVKKMRLPKLRGPSGNSLGPTKNFRTARVNAVLKRHTRSSASCFARKCSPKR
jgi:hypothetical protein